MSRQTPKVSKAAREALAFGQNQENVPEFIFAPDIGRKSIDEIESDLILLPVLQGMKVPRDMRARSYEIGELIKEAIKSKGFSGKRGEQLLVELPDGKSLLLAGLGRADKFCGGVASAVFKQLIGEAEKLNVKRVTIPFVPNRGTASCLTMKGMGHKLNSAVNAICKTEDASLSVKEIQIYCTPQALRYIKQGLEIPLSEDESSCG